MVHLLGYRRFHFAEPPLGIIKVFTKDKLSGQKLTIRSRGSVLITSERRGLPASPQGSLEPKVHDLQRTPQLCRLWSGSLPEEQRFAVDSQFVGDAFIYVLAEFVR